MNVNSPIPSSSTNLFESNRVIGLSGEALTKSEPNIVSREGPTTATAAGAATQTEGAVSRAFRGLVAALYLGIPPIIHDERAHNSLRTWCWVQSNNQTAHAPAREEVLQRVLMNALTCMPTDDIHDGMTLPLGIKLAACVKDFGEVGLGKLALFAAATAVDPEVLSHAFRWIGRLEDRESLHGRLRLLIRVLDAPSATVRDGAALGLVELGSPLAARALEEAASNEANESLREDLKQAANYLSRRS
ncbi:MAG: HEAT repeat domain-containing protein [Candidatus Rokubacteria bacterium]|nr:HEAT repeat domain-containing protein [Candidatus Rokubacteria bacterium]